jgi:hypothetical protein
VGIKTKSPEGLVKPWLSGLFIIWGYSKATI